MIQQKLSTNFQPFHLFLKTFLISVLVLFYSFDMIAQPFPESFTISGCSSTSVGGPTVNGDYVRGGADIQSCPCYENSANDNVVRYATAFGGVWVVSLSDDGTCTGSFNSANTFYSSGTGADACDISLSVAGGDCDPATTLSNVVYPPPADIPTLSEWGLILLALLLMTLGTLYLLQPSFRGEKLG